MSRVSGSPTRSVSTARLKGSKKPRNFLVLRCKEEGARPTTPELLKEGKGYDLRVRKLLQTLVAPTVGVNVLVDVIHQAEQDGERLLKESGPSGILGSVYLMLL
jgi:hypothetical protein